MSNKLILSFLLFTCVEISTLPKSTAQQLKVYELVYHDIDVNAYDKCARLMNGTHHIGCQSSLDGNVGTLFHVNESSQVDQVELGKHPPYIVILHASQFTRSTVKKFISFEKVSGIAVYSPENYSALAWSPDSQCPRYRYGLYSQSHGMKYAVCDSNPWNQCGDGLLEEDIPFPVFIFHNYTWARTVIDCHDEHNLDEQFPLCGAQLKGRMDGAQSTKDCLRRNNLQNALSPARYCDNMGGKTVLGSLQATNRSNTVEKPYILVSAALDSRSFEMTTFSPGVNSATGFITLLATAHALGKLEKTMKDQLAKNVMFVSFHGEAFDNMGSSRMMYDMSQDQFPFKVNKAKWQPQNFNAGNLSYVIEFGQLGLAENRAYVHYDPVSYQDSAIASGIDKIYNALRLSSNHSMNFVNQSHGIGLVPSSLQAILKEKNISGVVLTDYDKSFKNQHFFSRYDTLDKLGINPNDNASEEENLAYFHELAVKLSSISTSAAHAIVSLAGGESWNITNIQSDPSMIEQMLYCYLYRNNCTLFKKLTTVGTDITLVNAALSRYVGVYKSDSYKGVVYYTRNLLAYFIGMKNEANSTKSCKPENNKDEINKYFLFRGSSGNSSSYFCMQASVYSVDGRSPATVIPNYNYAQGQYSAWSESAWSKNAYSFKIFLVQDEVAQGITLLCGLLMFLSSLVIVYIINRKSNFLFANEIL